MAAVANICVGRKRGGGGAKTDRPQSPQVQPILLVVSGGRQACKNDIGNSANWLPPRCHKTQRHQVDKGFYVFVGNL